MALHRWLLYENNDDEKSLRNWVSSCALIFIMTMLVGHEQGDFLCCGLRYFIS